jgi:hypothetical protein
MLHKLALAAAVSLGVAAMPVAAMAAHGGRGGGSGGGGFGGGHSFSGGRSFSGGGPGFSSRAMPGGNAFVNRGVTGQPFANRGTAQPFVNRGTAQPFVNRNIQAGPPAGRTVIGNGRFAWNGHHRIHGRHIFGLLPGIGYAYYWYYGDCWAWTDDYGWVNVCTDVY